METHQIVLGLIASMAIIISLYYLKILIVYSKLHISMFLLLSLLPLYAWADNTPTFTASITEDVKVGKQFRLTFTVTFSHTFSSADDVKDFVPPKMSDFNVLFGPSRAIATRTQIIDGEQNADISVSYTYFLSAQQKGVFIIPEATVIVKGQQFRSQPLSIEVFPAGQVLSAKKKKVDWDAFMAMKISERPYRVNSPIVLECKLYTTVPIDSLANIEQLILPEDFKVESVDLKHTQWQLEHYEGKNYHTVVFRKLLLYPRHVGKLRIGDLYMNIYIKQTTNKDAFEAFFSSSIKETKRVGCPGFTIHAYNGLKN